MKSEDAILEVIKVSGPLLPIEVSSKLKLNSYVANAYLNELAGKGILKKSGESVGSDFLFYVEGQDKVVQERLTKLKEGAVTAKTFSSSPPASTEVLEKRKQFEERLKAIEKREEDQKSRQLTISEVKKEEPLKDVEPVQEKPIEAVTKIIKKTVSTITKKKPEKVDLISLAEDYLKTSNCSVMSREGKRKRSEWNYMVETDSTFGKLNFLVKVRDKKSISDADLNMAYTESLSYKAPVLFLTKGKLTKAAKEYLESNHMVKVHILN